jgi:hypothetical protein
MPSSLADACLKGGHNASNAALDLSSALLSSSPCAGADGLAD